ncbi:MAG TPA: asparaginase [Anaerolineales bacterium]
MAGNYQAIFEVTRGRIVESVHFGAAAVVDSFGRLLASLGDPQTITFLRSSAKPFQALPFIERGGDQTFHLTSKEVALICGSHDGTDEHVEVVKGIQAKVGVQESDLLCGTHPLSHVITVEAMRARGEALSPNRHNCSGKHTGMLAAARMRGLPIADYVNPEHPVQKTILETLAELCSLPLDQVEVGIDGCSVPNFAVPLYNAALGFARLCDPRGLLPERAAACRRITQSMMANPFMVAGPGRFDTRLMEVCSGRILAKGGAEGYMLLGIMGGVLGVESPGVGIAFKISDGDLPIRKANGDSYNRVRPAVALEILRQMGCISEKELEALAADFGPLKPVTNWRKIVVGETRPAFTLQRTGRPA